MREAELHAHARRVYEERLAMGVAKEQARKDLPLSNYTLARWKLDLHNLLHIFLAKRKHKHAQLEMRLYADAIGDIAQMLWPRTYAFFEEYTLHSVQLSRSEVKALGELLKQNSIEPRNIHGLSEKDAKALVDKLAVS
jgi:thymidylate synthase (FAD)